MLSHACYGYDPNLALFFLKEGADPNAGWWFRSSTLEIALWRKHPIELIKASAQAGADISEIVRKAARDDNVEYLKKLAQAGVQIDDGHDDNNDGFFITLIAFIAKMVLVRSVPQIGLQYRSHLKCLDHCTSFAGIPQLFHTTNTVPAPVVKMPCMKEYEAL